MSEHRAKVQWERGTAPFAANGYSLDHVWRFPNGVEVPASGAVEFRGNPDRVDPEAGLVASLSSCHMLTFLALAAGKRFTIDGYVDDAVGFLEKNAEGRLAVTRVVLRPKVRFEGEKQPSMEELDALHQAAHEHCFIANSVKTVVTVESK